MWEGRRLVDHMRDLCELRVDAVTLVGRAGGVPDLPAAGLGPLGGIAGALDHAAAHGFTHVLTLPCDTPRVPPALLDALLRRPPSYCLDAPVIGVWPAAFGAQLIGWLDNPDTDRSVKGWARSIGALPLASPAPLANVNRPEDLMAL